MKMRSVLFTLVGLFSAAVLFGSTSVYAEKARGVTQDTINYGLISDMTGPAAADSIAFGDGVVAYLRYISDSGGINGRKVKLIREDDHYTIPGAIAAFKKLVYRDKIFAMTGASGTGHTYALFSQFKKEKLPVNCHSLSKRVIQPVHPYVFISAPTYDDGIDVIFDYIVKDLNVKSPRIAFVYPDNEYGKTALMTARERAKFYEFEIADEEVLNFGALDATSQVLGLKRKKVDHIVLHGAIGTAVALLRDMRKYGLKVPVFSTFVSCREEVIKMAGSAAKRYYGINYFNAWEDDTPGMNEVRDISLKLYPKKKNRPRHYIHGWVTGMVMSEGMKRAGKDLNPESMVKALESIKDFDTKGLTGLINYSSTNHKGGKYSRLYKSDVKNVKLVPITGWREPAK